MNHPIFRVLDFHILAPYTLEVRFDDETKRVINFHPVLAGELFWPLRDLTLFNQVHIDPEVHTLVWPNGADFDPATLHDWPKHVDTLTEYAHSRSHVHDGGPLVALGAKRQRLSAFRRALEQLRSKRLRSHASRILRR